MPAPICPAPTMATRSVSMGLPPSRVGWQPSIRRGMLPVNAIPHLGASRVVGVRRDLTYPDHPRAAVSNCLKSRIAAKGTEPAIDVADGNAPSKAFGAAPDGADCG